MVVEEQAAGAGRIGFLRPGVHLGEDVVIRVGPHEVEVLLGDARHATDDQCRERGTERPDQIHLRLAGQALGQRVAGAANHWFERGHLLGAEEGGQVATDDRVEGWIGRAQLVLVERPQVLGERLESPLHERGRVLGHGDDVVPPGQVEDAGHHLGDRIGLTQRGQHREVVVHLSRFERVVAGRHP